MAFDVTTYDAGQLAIVFAGVPASGFADGEFITCARNEPAFELEIGADGEGVRSKTNNRSGQMTLTLIQGSAVNDLLSQIANVDENSPNGDGIGPFLVKDNSGRTIITASAAWIRERPEVSFARESSAREWVLETANLEFVNIGGNPVA